MIGKEGNHPLHVERLEQGGGGVGVRTELSKTNVVVVKAVVMFVSELCLFVEVFTIMKNCHSSHHVIFIAFI